MIDWVGLKTGCIVQPKLPKWWPQLCRVLRRSLFKTNLVEFSLICVVIQSLNLWTIHPSQSIMYVPLQVNRFQKSILLIVQYKHLKSCSGDFIFRNLILRTRSCGTGFVTRHIWLLHFRLTEIFQVKLFYTISESQRGQPFNMFTIS